MNKWNATRLTALLIAATVTLVQSPCFAKQQSKFKNPEANFRLVLKQILKNSADKNVTRDSLYQAATEGMLSSLNPKGRNWNQLLTPEDQTDLRIETQGEVAGIGATLKWLKSARHAQVFFTLPNSPAKKAGLKPGDLLLDVNGRPAKGGLRDLVSQIRGKPGHVVKLTVLRGDRVMHFKIKRQLVAFSNVSAKMVNPSTAFLTIRFFADDTAKQVAQQLQALEIHHPKRLILDLRENDGGVFSQVVRVAELFLAKGKVVVESRARSGAVKKFRSANRIPWSPKTKLVVLTNHHTLCGAEVLAEALRENRHAKILGVTTGGKWNMQIVEQLPNKFAIKYTVRELLSPSGISYDGTGIKPDFAVNGPQGEKLESIFHNPNVEATSMDPQLRAALALPL